MSKMKPIITSASDIKTIGDLIHALYLRRATHEAIRSPDAQPGDHAIWQAVTVATKGFDDEPGVQEIRAICLARYGEDLTLEAVRKLCGEFCEATGLSVDDANATPLVDVLAKLRAREETPNGADTGADASPNSSTGGLPENDDALRLAKLLVEELPKGKSRDEVAREFKGETGAKPQSLLRKIRKCSALKSLVDRADPKRKK